MSRSVLLEGLPPSGPCHGFVSDLVLRCGRGDEAALAALFDLFHAPARAVLLRRGTWHATDDRLVEAFARLWQAAPTFSPAAGNAAVWVLGWLTDHHDEMASATEPAVA